MPVQERKRLDLMQTQAVGVFHSQIEQVGAMLFD
jgi:hypothetical protein